MTEAKMKQLKFLERFVIPIQNGIKTQTARTSSNLEIGDVVLAVTTKRGQFALLHITDKTRRALSTFNYADAIREGCKDLDDFKVVWNRIHPRKGFNPEQFVYVIKFELVIHQGNKDASVLELQT
jgi:hypothetical protein